MLFSLSSLLAGLSLMGSALAGPGQSSLAQGLPLATSAPQPVTVADNGRHEGWYKHGDDADDDEDGDGGFAQRHRTLHGCVASLQNSRLFTLQTRSGLITVEPVGAAARPRAVDEVQIGRLVNAAGRFTGNGVYLADKLHFAGFERSGACPFATQPFPVNGGVFQPGTTGSVTFGGTIINMTGNSLLLSSNRGNVTVFYDANTLVEYGNGTLVGAQNLRAGESVTVVGLANGSSVSARTIVIQSGLTSQNAILTGVVAATNFGANQFTVFSGLHATTVQITPQTIVQRGNASVDPFGIRPFQLVTVYGNASGGVIVANVVKLNS